MSLDLGSKLPPAGPPAAETAIPPGMAMGPVLLLKTPKPEKAQPYQPDKEPEDFERPKGKILLFWGCGETARPGQPLVIDFAQHGRRADAAWAVCRRTGAHCLSAIDPDMADLGRLAQ